METRKRNKFRQVFYKDDIVYNEEGYFTYPIKRRRPFQPKFMKDIKDGQYIIYRMNIEMMCELLGIRLSLKEKLELALGKGWDKKTKSVPLTQINRQKNSQELADMVNNAYNMYEKKSETWKR